MPHFTPAQDATSVAAPSPATTFNDEAPLDPQCKAFIETMAQSKGETWEQMGPVKAREVFNSLKQVFGEGPQDVIVEDRKLQDRFGVRIYKPTKPADEASPLPVVVYFHGGGWVLGNLDTHDALCRRICSKASCAVVAVDYRLAPEHPFPAPLNDCYGAFKYV
ncbi:MAG: alpha/beta hydrolase fold domain-containing protein, partial [Planctomycetales bacterium]|nr:alpha/beta hydrolase fold domain-containing protein [Planctomycetales bacterium]